jgi:hypothetical protein
LPAFILFFILFYFLKKKWFLGNNQELGYDINDVTLYCHFVTRDPIMFEKAIKDVK